MRSFTMKLIVALCLAGCIDGFVIVPAPAPPTSSSSSLAMTVLSYNGKKMDFKPGTPLSRAVAQLGVNVKYSCKKYVTLRYCYGR
jgi:hypothetical protein